MFSRMGLQYNHFSRFLSESLSLCFIWWIFCEVLAIRSSRCRFLTLKRERSLVGLSSQKEWTMAYTWLTKKQRHEHLHAKVLLIFCWSSLTSQSSLPRFRPDSLAPVLAAGLLRCSVTPGGGAVDHWASRPSGEVWVEVVEEDVVPLQAPPSVCSAKTATSKSEGCFSPHFMTGKQIFIWNCFFFYLENILLKEMWTDGCTGPKAQRRFSVLKTVIMQSLQLYLLTTHRACMTGTAAHSWG